MCRPQRVANVVGYAASAMDQLVFVANVACWGAIVVVWLAAAIRDGVTPRAVRTRGSTEPGMAVLAVVAIAAVLTVGPSISRPSPWRHHGPG